MTDQRHPMPDPTTVRPKAMGQRKTMSEPAAIALFAAQSVAMLVAFVGLYLLEVRAQPVIDTWHLPDWKLILLLILNLFVIKMWIASYRIWRKTHP